MGPDDKSLEALRRIVETVAREMGERLRRLRILSLEELLDTLPSLVCGEWGNLEPQTPLVEKSAPCTLEVKDVEAYTGFVEEQLSKLSERVIDLAMEALAKHVETMDDDAYARLSWLLVSYSTRVAHRLNRLRKLAKTMPHLVELAATLIVLRAYALFKLISSMDSGEAARLIPSLEAILAGFEQEEETLLERLEQGLAVAIH